jgi:phospholipid/cholesterol/gamma-HCH transport system substrate-binding protein
MVLEFGVKSVDLFAVKPVVVEIDAPRVDGLSPGSPVTYQGMPVGTITRMDRNIDFSKPDGVIIQATLPGDYSVPSNVHAEIVTTNLISSGSAIALELPIDPATKKPIAPIRPAKGAPYPAISADFVGLRLLPPEYGDMVPTVMTTFANIGAVADDFHKQKIIEQWYETVQNINDRVNRISERMENIEDIFTDPKVKTDLQQSIANLHHATDSLTDFTDHRLPELSNQASGFMTNANGFVTNANNSLSNVDQATNELKVSLATASHSLDNINAITDKINNGPGTASLLLNDPKLYQGLVDNSRQLNAALLDGQRVIEQIEQEGFSLHMK